MGRGSRTSIDMDRRKAMALALMKANPKRSLRSLSAETGLSTSTLTKLRHEPAYRDKVPREQVNAWAKEIEGLAVQATHSILEHLTSEEGKEKMKKASLSEMTRAAAATHGMMRLERGEPTTIHADLSPRQLQDRMEAIEMRLKNELAGAEEATFVPIEHDDDDAPQQP